VLMCMCVGEGGGTVCAVPCVGDMMGCLPKAKLSFYRVSSNTYEERRVTVTPDPLLHTQLQHTPLHLNSRTSLYLNAHTHYFAPQRAVMAHLQHPSLHVTSSADTYHNLLVFCSFLLQSFHYYFFSLPSLSPFSSLLYFDLQVFRDSEAHRPAGLC
jgi:hypothetical protein